MNCYGWRWPNHEQLNMRRAAKAALTSGFATKYIDSRQDIEIL
jgi:hypothetical protein